MIDLFCRDRTPAHISKLKEEIAVHCQIQSSLMACKLHSKRVQSLEGGLFFSKPEKHMYFDGNG